MKNSPDGKLNEISNEDKTLPSKIKSTKPEQFETIDGEQTMRTRKFS